MKPAPPVTRILRFACTHTQTPTNNQTRSSDRATYTARSSDRIPAKSPGRTWRTGAARASAAGGWCAPRCCCHWPPSAPSRRAPGTHKNATDPPSPTLRSSQFPPPPLKKKKNQHHPNHKIETPLNPTHAIAIHHHGDGSKKKKTRERRNAHPATREGRIGGERRASLETAGLNRIRPEADEEESLPDLSRIYSSTPPLPSSHHDASRSSAHTHKHTHRLLPTGPRSRCP